MDEMVNVVCLIAEEVQLIPGIGLLLYSSSCWTGQIDSPKGYHRRHFRRRGGLYST